MIEVFDGFILVNQIYSYATCSCKRVFNGVGNFSLTLNDFTHKDDLLHDRFMVIDGDCYIIENIHGYKNSKKELQLEITGRHLNTLANRRVVDSVQMVQSETVETQLRQLVDTHFIQPTLPVRRMQEIVLAESNQIEIYPLSNYTVTGENEKPLSIEQALNKICSYYDLGWRFIFRPEQKQIAFEVYQGRDRTAHVIFSEEYGNVSASDLYDQRENYYNVFYQNGVFSGVEEGLRRREKVLDEQETANDYKRILSADTVIINDGGFLYREDWDLGDTVTFIDNTLGYTVKRPVMSVTETRGKSVTIDAVFGDRVPTIFDKLKR